MTPTKPCWVTATVGEVCRFQGGTQPPRSTFRYTSETGYVRLLQIRDFESDEYKTYVSRRHNLRYVDANDILLARYGASVGKILRGKSGAINVALMQATPDESILSKSFLYYFFQIQRVQNYLLGLGGRSAQAGFNQGELNRIEISIPCRAEQAAIVTTLDIVKNQINACGTELTLERERKAALMDYLFTHGTRGEPTKQTEIGEIPESWELATLGELCEDDLGLIQTGPFGSQLHASDYVQSGVPVVNPTHLLVNGIETDRLPHISEKLADGLSRHYLQEGDILISRRGDFSRFAYIGSEQTGWLCGTGCLLVRLANSDVDNYFLAVSISLEQIQNYLKQAAVGTIMPNLNTRILAEMPVMLPGIEEQRRIAEVVRACESKIAALELEEQLLDELFRTMLEELMTGRLSTVPLIEEHQAR
jgi:type I restriction enzyme S subunit